MTSSLAGGCQCGAIRYAISGAPRALYVCHCRECQKQSASAFGVSLMVASADFRLTRGAVKSWTRVADSGRRRRCLFCAECGMRLWHEAEPPEGTLAVKGGSLDVPPDLSTATHIWVSRKLAGVVIPEGRPRFEEEPD